MVCNPETMHTSGVETEGVVGGVRSPVALLRSVSPWERVGGEVVEKRRRPPGEFQRVEASPDVVENFADDRGLGDEPHDAHPLAATAQERIDLVYTPDEARPRLPAGCKPGTVGGRRIGRLDLRRDLKEGLAPSRDPAVGVRVSAIFRPRHGRSSG